MRRRLIYIISAIVVLVSVYAAYRLLYSHEGVVPDEAEYPVRGLDISSHNGDVDFRAVKAEGYEFVFIKATEGSGFKDPRFYGNISRARKAGLKVAAYHFFRFDATGYMQALNFVHSLRGQTLDMPAVIDVEEWTNPTDRTTEEVVRTLASLIENLERVGVPVMLYTNKDGYDRFIEGRFEQYPIWLCSFSRIKKDVTWTFWQYTHRGYAEGVKGRVDMNVFNGSREDWARWCQEHRTLIQ